MQVDFLIVGQGLAGSLLARSLRAKGARVAVVDDAWRSAASLVAAGLMTPLTGRRFTLTPDYPGLFARAGEVLGALGVFHPVDVYRLFVDAEQRERGRKRADDPTCQPFIRRITERQGELQAEITDEQGGALMKGAWVDLPKLLAETRALLVAEGALIEAAFDPAEVHVDASGVVWRHVRAAGVVYCDGYKSAQRGPFAYLPWQPAKGEALDLRSDAPQSPFILNREGWALPLGLGRWRAGTNWEWAGLDETPTLAQRDKFIARFQGYFRAPVSVEVTGHLAGVRPCTSDNLPFLGTHPTEPRFHLFNGLGPRGTVWAPTLAEEMADHLVSGRALRPSCDLRRFG
jgi:glycine/D-amino acid oxidase-like deaminating enzyme